MVSVTYMMTDLFVKKINASATMRDITGGDRTVNLHSAILSNVAMHQS